MFPTEDAYCGAYTTLAVSSSVEVWDPIHRQGNPRCVNDESMESIVSSLQIFQGEKVWFLDVV